MSPHARFIFILLSLCAALVDLVIGVAVWLQPAAGDLARIGAYAENLYGWNGTEFAFEPPLAVPGTAEGHYDMVVLGDSFSLRTTPDRQTRAGGFWTDFLAAETGLSIGVFDINHMAPEALLQPASPRATPPRLVILQVSERMLRQRLGGLAVPCPAPAAEVSLDLPHVGPMPPARALRRDRGHRLSRGALDRAVDYLHRNLPRWAFGYDSSAVVRLALSRDDLFTSRRPGDLLVYAEDYDKARWTVGEWDGFACRLLSLQQRIEADGRTAFLFLMIPDKSTAYADMLTPLDRSLDGFAVLARAHGLHMPRLDTILRSAIAGGLRDVYLPDDTHFGYAGTRLTAHAVLDYARPMYAGMPP